MNGCSSKRNPMFPGDRHPAGPAIPGNIIVRRLRRVHDAIRLPAIPSACLPRLCPPPRVHWRAPRACLVDLGRRERPSGRMDLGGGGADSGAIGDDDNAARRPPATVQPNTVQPNTVQPNTVQPNTVQPNTVQQHCAAKHCAAKHCAAGRSSARHAPVARARARVRPPPQSRLRPCNSGSASQGIQKRHNPGGRPASREKAGRRHPGNGAGNIVACSYWTGSGRPRETEARSRKGGHARGSARDG